MTQATEADNRAPLVARRTTWAAGRRGARALAYAIAVGVLVAAATWSARSLWSSRVGTELRPVRWRVPPFAFDDPTGISVSCSSLLGRPWIADFIFTRCTSACPMMTARMRILQRAIESPELRFISFSVDPANDTRDVLRRYAAQWGAEDPRWILLRTETEPLRGLMDGMRVVAQPTGDLSDPIVHTTSFFLVDATGRVLGTYDSADDRELQRLLADARRLLAETAGHREMREATGDGKAQMTALGCSGCHDNPALAPSVDGIWGHQVHLADGSMVTVDAAYVRESILAPDRKVVAGYLETMPSYAEDLSSAQIDTLVDYVRSRSGTADGSSPPLAITARDPVCGMPVRITPGTPQATGAGRSYYFCSDACRTKFLNRSRSAP